MREPLLPLLLLTAVAFTSSNVVIESTEEFLNQDDNTELTDEKLFAKIVCGDDLSGVNPETIALCNVVKLKNYVRNDNNKVFRTINGAMSKDNENYNGKGFRKEQWHNYPRQLDRLQRFLYERGKRDDEKETNVEYGPQVTADYNTNEFYPAIETNEIGTNEIFLNNNYDNTQNIYDAVVTSSNPLLILKIRLACLSNTLDSKLIPDKFTDLESRLSMENKAKLPDLLVDVYQKSSKDNLPKGGINWDIEPRGQSYFDDKPNEFKSLPSKKRIFSVWSRLQSLNPKGHELHNRRYLHAYYGGLPNTDGGGGMSAETRALSRPPGSPLRWG